VIKYLTVISLAFLLIACHPSYTVQQSEKVARKLGVDNQMEIERWNNRVLAQQATLVLAVAEVEAADDNHIESADLLQIAHRSINSKFSQVSLVEGEHSVSSARRQAGYLNAGFLLFFELQQKPDVAEVRQRWQLQVTILDLSANTVVDKAIITTTGARFESKRDSGLALLEEPLSLLAGDLAGAEN
jgi:hypothetical protein